MDGIIDNVAVRAQLTTRRRLAFRFTATYGTPLDPGCGFSRRVSPWSRIMARLGLGRRTGSPTLDSTFVVRGPIANRISKTVADDILELAQRGEVRGDAVAVVYDTVDLESPAEEVLRRLARISVALGGARTGSPYRG